MPRPTRTRTAAARRVRDTSSDAAPAPVQTVVEPVRSDEASDNIYGVSDREVEHQKKTKAATNAKATPSERSFMTTRSTRSRATIANNATDSKALEDSRTRRDAAMSMLDNLTSTTNDMPPDGTEMIVSPVIEAGRNTHMDASSLLGPRAGAGMNLSGLEINDSEIFGNLDSSFDASRADGRDESSSIGHHTGTRSADTSAFNVSVFKRQPRRRRQSSIVSREDAPIRPSSRGPTTPGLSSNFSLGNFKRRQRQPSILLSSAQKATMSVQRSRAASQASENAVESEAGEDSFLPEAEGTPVRPSRGRPSAARDADEEDATQARSRKRKSAESHDVEAAKRQAVELEEALHQSIEMDEGSSPPSILDRTPELDDDSILAPPASDSGSEGSPTVWPSLKSLGKRKHAPAAPRHRRTPDLDNDESDLSEPPSLTHSPNLKAAGPGAKNKGKAAQRQQESPKISTADLEALLPRRRRKVRRGGEGSEDEEAGSGRDVYDIPSQPKASKKKASRPLNGSSKANGTVQAQQTAAPARRKTRQTYGSRIFDKENTVEGDSIEVNREASMPVDDSVFEAGATTASLDLAEELKAASKKFKEVDKWELDFEEVVESSSPLPEGR